MILVDTSVWIDHFKTGNVTLARLLDHGAVLAHPWVVGELALGQLRDRNEVIRLLNSLPQATVATADEILILIEEQELYGTGIGYVDAQLLAATRLTPDATLWTRDRRLTEAATRLKKAFDPDSPPDLRR